VVIWRWLLFCYVTYAKSRRREYHLRSNAMYQISLVCYCAHRLVQRALEIAAAESGLTMAQLKALPIGRARRSRHDDTTAVVMFF
jgi:hypothetical protein